MEAVAKLIDGQVELKKEIAQKMETAKKKKKIE